MWLTLHLSLRSTTRLRQVNIISLEAMSPSSTSFAETVATLRYATRARCIVNMPVVNLDSGTATIRSLKKEVAALRRLLCDANVSGMNVFSFFLLLLFISCVYLNSVHLRKYKVCILHGIILICFKVTYLLLRVAHGENPH